MLVPIVLGAKKPATVTPCINACVKALSGEEVVGLGVNLPPSEEYAASIEIDMMMIRADMKQPITLLNIKHLFLIMLLKIIYLPSYVKETPGQEGGREAISLS